MDSDRDAGRVTLCTLPREMIEHVLTFCPFEDRMSVAAVQHDALDDALGSRLVSLYRHVVRLLPCGPWFEASEKKFYYVRLVPELSALNVDFYTNSNRKRMCFNRKNGIRLVRKCRLLRDDETLYFNRHSYHLDVRSVEVGARDTLDSSDDTVTHNNERYWKTTTYPDRRTGCACLFAARDGRVFVFNFNMINKSMNILMFKNQKLLSKETICKDDVSKAWLHYFYFGRLDRLLKSHAARAEKLSL